MTPKKLLIFNGYILTQKGDMIVLRQKEQGKKIKLVNVSF